MIRNSIYLSMRHRLRGNYRYAQGIALTVVCLAISSGVASAGVKSEAAREVTEFVLKKFGKETVEEGAERFTVKVEALATRHGDDAIKAVRKVGPQAVKVIEQAGAGGTQAAKLLAKYGDEGVWLAKQPNGLALYAKYGDDAAEAMLKHPGIADDVIAAYGKEGAQAMGKLGKDNALDLAKFVKDGELAKIGRGAEILGVINKFGDSAMQFVWKHKKSLAVGAALTAFLADPKAFIDGTKDIAQYAIETGGQVAGKVVESVGNVAAETSRGITENTNFTPVLLAIVAVIAVYVLSRTLLPRILHRKAEVRPDE